MTKILFNTQKDVIEYQFTQSMWSGEKGMTKVLFNTQKDVLEC